MSDREELFNRWRKLQDSTVFNFAASMLQNEGIIIPEGDLCELYRKVGEFNHELNNLRQETLQFLRGK